MAIQVIDEEDGVFVDNVYNKLNDHHHLDKSLYNTSILIDYSTEDETTKLRDSDKGAS